MNQNTLPRGPRRLTEEEIEALRIDMKESSDLMREQFAARRKLKQLSNMDNRIDEVMSQRWQHANT